MLFAVWKRYIQEQIKEKVWGTAHQSPAPLGSHVRAFASKNKKKENYERLQSRLTEKHSQAGSAYADKNGQ